MLLHESQKCMNYKTHAMWQLRRYIQIEGLPINILNHTISPISETEVRYCYLLGII